MATWTIEYVYDDRADARDLHRPAHREYLAALADEGTMHAYGRYDDEGAPGALLVCEADDVDDVESIVAGDPFVAAALVPEHRIRRWPATWAKALGSRLEA
ncbi:YciI family protein [Demequina muriae]|uniref:YciI family protein n=1 Tax=Demequina muriae TaxID=3051664 RepID=A0ABT8GK78_9MICO|nr:YciI family protein [Demequina sp. EGI L300058]MDN4481842.1 YciI family protein [Demequina sp. EGI L300058]